MKKTSINTLSLNILIFSFSFYFSFLLLILKDFIIFYNPVPDILNLRYFIYIFYNIIQTPYYIGEGVLNFDGCGLLGCIYIKEIGILFQGIFFFIITKIIIYFGKNISYFIGIKKTFVSILLLTLLFLTVILKVTIPAIQKKCVVDLVNNNEQVSYKQGLSTDEIWSLYPEYYLLSGTGKIRIDPSLLSKPNYVLILKNYKLETQDTNGFIKVPKGREYEIYCSVPSGIILPINIFYAKYL